MAFGSLGPGLGPVLLAAAVLLLLLVVCSGYAYGLGSSVSVSARVAPVLRVTAGTGADGCTDLWVRTNRRDVRLDYSCGTGGGSVAVPRGGSRCHGVTGWSLCPR